MSPYRKQGRLTWYLTLVTGERERPYLRLSTGTRDRATADQMQAMLDLFSERGRRWLWVRDGLLAKRITVPEVWDAYVAGTLDELKEHLADVDLRPQENAWKLMLERAVTDGTMAPETVRKYRAQVRTLLGAEGPAWRSKVTAPLLRAALDALPGSGTNRRRHAAAWTSFLDYCVEHGALEANPLRTLKLPKSNRARERYTDWVHVPRILHLLPAGPHRALSALRHGAGVEMQAALRTTRRDVDLATRIVWAHGAKTATRDRQVLVLDDACWAELEAYVRSGGFLPDAKLFPIASKVHAKLEDAACIALRAEGVTVREGYTLHNARHTFAVEMVRRGYEYKVISANLGHASERMVQQLYAKHRSRAADLIQSARRVQGGAS